MRLRIVMLQLAFTLVLPVTAWAQRIPVNGGSPRVSPDGTRILFSSNRTGRTQLYEMRADGSDERQLTSDSAGAYAATWSPDGKRIVFMTRVGNGSAIAVMNADGSNARVISSEVGDQAPSWSPDGRRILFASGKFPNINIFTMNADGSGRTNLSPNPDFDYGPTWSPDGKHVAFVHPEQGQGPHIWIMNADGSNRRKLSTSMGESPDWSPDSRYVAFQSPERAPTGQRTEHSYIRAVEVKTGTERTIGQHASPRLDETPSWFPDGKRLAIQSRETGAWELFILDLAGEMRRLGK